MDRGVRLLSGRRSAVRTEVAAARLRHAGSRLTPVTPSLREELAGDPQLARHALRFDDARSARARRPGAARRDRESARRPPSSVCSGNVFGAVARDQRHGVGVDVEAGTGCATRRWRRSDRRPSASSFCRACATTSCVSAAKPTSTGTPSLRATAARRGRRGCPCVRVSVSVSGPSPSCIFCAPASAGV